MLVVESVFTWDIESFVDLCFDVVSLWLGHLLAANLLAIPLLAANLLAASLLAANLLANICTLAVTCV